MIDDTRTAAPERTPARDTGAMLLAAGGLAAALARHPAAPFPYYSVRSASEPRGLLLWHGSPRLIGSRC
jgi:hypothetical protein